MNARKNGPQQNKKQHRILCAQIQNNEKTTAIATPPRCMIIHSKNVLRYEVYSDVK